MVEITDITDKSIWGEVKYSLYYEKDTGKISCTCISSAFRGTKICRHLKELLQVIKDRNLIKPENIEVFNKIKNGRNQTTSL